MERATINIARELFGKNFIGVDELNPLFSKMGLSLDNISVPDIHYSMEELVKYSKEYILILGLSKVEGVRLSISFFREVFGVDPDVYEPCFYNQDWYLQEEFLTETLDVRWYLLKRTPIERSRATQPEELLKQDIIFPSAILCVYAFFANSLFNKEILWSHDFVWCNDVDHNNDRIYVGKYNDIDGINKNGFSIHRHLTLRNCYSSITVC